MKYTKIGYWILIIVFAALMTFSSVIYFSHSPAVVLGIHRLGYPEYLLNLLGTAKLIGVISILQNRLTLLKEWAYAGFTINLIGASWSHISVGEPIILPLILLIVLMGSYILWKQIMKPATNAAGNRVSGFAL